MVGEPGFPPLAKLRLRSPGDACRQSGSSRVRAPRLMHGSGNDVKSHARPENDHFFARPDAPCFASRTMAVQCQKDLRPGMAIRFLIARLAAGGLEPDPARGAALTGIHYGQPASRKRHATRLFVATSTQSSSGDASAVPNRIGHEQPKAARQKDCKGMRLRSPATRTEPPLDVPQQPACTLTSVHNRSAAASAIRLVHQGESAPETG